MNDKNEMKLSKQIKVALTLIDQNDPTTGGEKSNIHIKESLQQNTNIHLNIIYLNDIPKWIDWFYNRAFKVYIFFSNFWYAQKILRRGYDIVIEDGFFHERMFLFHILSKLSKVKIMLLVRDLLNTQHGKNSYHVALECSKVVITNSYAMQKEIVKEKQDITKKCAVVYPGFDKPCTDGFQRKWGNKPCVILFVGAVVPQKGLHTVVDAIAIVVKNYRNILLKVAGKMDRTSSYVVALKRKISDLGIDPYIQFLGMLDRESLNKQYMEAELFVFPSDFEPFGQVLLEAMSWGLPVLASDSGGATEIIGNINSGMLIAVGNVNEWAKNIEKVLCNIELRRKMGSNSRKRSMMFGGWEEMNQSFNKILSKLILAK